MIIDCISDLHGEQPLLEGGDILIIAGDLTASHSIKEFHTFLDWLKKQDYKHKVFIAGNHDEFIQFLDEYFENFFKDNNNIHYLFDSGIEIDGIKFWGSPWTLRFPEINPRCKTYTGTEQELYEKFELIPEDIDILITHSPPFGILDNIKRHQKEEKHVGSKSLSKQFNERISPKIHVFGHIHECGGKKIDTTFTTFINASVINEIYDMENNPIRINY